MTFLWCAKCINAFLGLLRSRLKCETFEVESYPVGEQDSILHSQSYANDVGKLRTVKDIIL